MKKGTHNVFQRWMMCGDFRRNTVKFQQSAPNAIRHKVPALRVLSATMGEFTCFTFYFLFYFFFFIYILLSTSDQVKAIYYYYIILSDVILYFIY